MTSDSTKCLRCSEVEVKVIAPIHLLPRAHSASLSLSMFFEKTSLNLRSQIKLFVYKMKTVRNTDAETTIARLRQWRDSNAARFHLSSIQGVEQQRRTLSASSNVLKIVYRCQEYPSRVTAEWKLELSYGLFESKD